MNFPRLQLRALDRLIGHAIDDLRIAELGAEGVALRLAKHPDGTKHDRAKDVERAIGEARSALQRAQEEARDLLSVIDHEEARDLGVAK